MSTVEDLFRGAGVPYSGVVPWGSEVPLDRPGVYVVALSEHQSDDGGRTECPLDFARIHDLIRERPEAMVDGVQADVATLAQRLSEMWVPGQSIVYVGLAGSSVRHRVSQFYATRIGARAPHAGGWPVKMLDLTQAPLWVHYGASAEPDVAEAAMVDRFVDGVSPDVARTLIDPTAALPFANLTFPKGRRKRHGLTGVKDRRVNHASGNAPLAPKANTLKSVPVVDAPIRRWTQRLTAADIKAGQVRVPSVSKDILPADPAQIAVRVGNETFDASWNPRTAGDFERSGVIRIEKGQMQRLFSPSGPRELVIDGGEYRIG